MGTTFSKVDNSTSYRNYDSPQHQPSYHPYGEPPQHYPADYNYPSQNSNTNSNHYHRQFTVQPNRRRFERTYSRIADEFATLEQVKSALQYAGLESSNLIVGIDFTKSNEWTGKKSSNRQNLHHNGVEMNPYEQAISIVGRTLSTFDEDDLIPCFGFGDASTRDQDVFSFYPKGHSCYGFQEVLSRYREIVPHQILPAAGPTSFAPIIEMAMTIVEESGGQYHILLIITNGQVARSGNANTAEGHFSPQERRTVDAIVRASQYPLSIVVVGVGDGPWNMMKTFENDHIPGRAFKNFKFVNFTEIMSKKEYANQRQREEEFARQASMKIPMQFTATLDLSILGCRTGRSPGRVALPPPEISNSSSRFSLDQINRSDAEATSNSVASSVNNNRRCPICLTNVKDMAFGCGHQTCHGCGPALSICPICRRNIEMRIRLY